MIGSLVAAAFAFGMVSLGGVACAAPAFASRLYGVPANDPNATAWVRAAGLRDVGLALAIALLLFYGDSFGAAIVSIATALVAVTDAVNVVTTRGLTPVLPLLTHVSGIAVGAGAGVLLLAGV